MSNGLPHRAKSGRLNVGTHASIFAIALPRLVNCTNASITLLLIKPKPLTHDPQFSFS